ncbi:hypothetical protein [Nannocystis punicea]|uniref:Uncharacterized protein n=1 Tax=Nannocystis punicea TaxID=2995304 RepID=A0ABY7H123_9BACT|nr:hypothetical protein [Nannocystis poenicansa]WAS92954.1 hypothetical protein O0S08_42845 [Nannocystis poenicansa]
MSGFSTGPGVTTAPVGSSTSSSSSTGLDSTSMAAGSSTEGSSTGAGSSGGDGPKLDMSVPDGGAGPPLGCAGKIDFLVSVSASGTMLNQQKQLIASFPEFVEAIEEQLPGFDVHILSAASHALWAFDDCADCNGPSCDPAAGLPFCGVQPEFCDKGKIGASVTFPVGKNASNRRCDLHGGNRYIISGEPNMAEMFGCIAQVGLTGGSRVAEAMVRALGPEWVDGPNKCNKGFLRDDALLVVVLIKDTFDEESAGTPESWIAALREAKHGDDDAFALLVLTTDADDGFGEHLCQVWSGDTNPLRVFVNGVKHGFIGSICAESYKPFFTETIEHIVEMCEDFVPQQ